MGGERDGLPLVALPFRAVAAAAAPWISIVDGEDDVTKPSPSPPPPLPTSIAHITVATKEGLAVEGWWGFMDVPPLVEPTVTAAAVVVVDLVGLNNSAGGEVRNSTGAEGLHIKSRTSSSEEPAELSPKLRRLAWDHFRFSGWYVEWSVWVPEEWWGCCWWWRSGFLNDFLESWWWGGWEFGDEISENVIGLLHLYFSFLKPVMALLLLLLFRIVVFVVIVDAVVVVVVVLNLVVWRLLLHLCWHTSDGTSVPQQWWSFSRSVNLASSSSSNSSSEAKTEPSSRLAQRLLLITSNSSSELWWSKWSLSLGKAESTSSMADTGLGTCFSNVPTPLLLLLSNAKSSVSLLFPLAIRIVLEEALFVLWQDEEIEASIERRAKARRLRWTPTPLPEPNLTPETSLTSLTLWSLMDETLAVAITAVEWRPLQEFSSSIPP